MEVIFLGLGFGQPFVFEAVFYVLRTGCPWRDLPEHFGKWYSVYTRFYRFTTYGVFGKIVEALQNEADLEMVFIDSTIVRAHQHAAGASKKTERNRRSSDWSIKRRVEHQKHAAVDALG